MSESTTRTKREKLVSIPERLSEIAEAVKEAEERPSTKGVEGLEYRVEEAYYPGDYNHLVDLSECPVERRGTAFLDCMIRLAEREFLVNSVRLDDDGVLEKLHIVRANWVTEKLPANGNGEQYD